MEYVGYLTSVIIGISLGLIGGGGSILTVPLLVYVFNLDAAVATFYSLFIVGITSAAGSINYFRNGLINIKTALVFGIPSSAGVFITRIYIVPAIPDPVFSIGTYSVTKHILLMMLFAILMIAASYSMIRKATVPGVNKDNYFNYPLIIIQGFVVGIITGFVGAGGGFMIIPALVFILRLPMKQAIGTSLLIVTVNSLLGFFSSAGHIFIQWRFIFTIAAFAITGIFIGIRLSKNIDGSRLKPAFGWFIFVMGIYIIVKETVIH